jgi:hypothetical protein
MGNKSAKKTNQMLEEQTRRTQDIQDIAGQRSGEIYGAGRGDIDWARGNLKSMYDALGAGGGDGGGGGPAFEAMEFNSSTLPFYLQMMNEGGYSEADKANILSYATGPITGMFEGLRRNLQSMASGRGIPAYGSGLSRLARDQAYAGGEMAKGVAADLAEKILASRFQGASGATGIESEKRAFEVSERDKKLADARARAAAASAGANADYAHRMGIINAMLGLEGDKDLAYMDRQLGAGGQAFGGISSRVDETPLWQKALVSAVPSAIGAGIGAISGGGYNPLSAFKKKKPYDPDAGYVIG